MLQNQVDCVRVAKEVVLRPS